MTRAAGKATNRELLGMFLYKCMQQISYWKQREAKNSTCLAPALMAIQINPTRVLNE